MPIWIFSALIGLLMALETRADIITRLPTAEKRVALTFDGCENTTPAFLDPVITAFLLNEKLPVTLFLTGRFAQHNTAALAPLSQSDWVEIENHSLDHPNHMERLSDAAIKHEIEANDALLFTLFGRHTHYFRFPAGNSDPRAIALAETLGYKVVHWSFASGDPVKELSPDHLGAWVESQTRPGSILIFHINGRGYATGRALPGIIAELRRRGYRFVTLAEALK